MKLITKIVHPVLNNGSFQAVSAVSIRAGLRIRIFDHIS
jgi:hypothetical protein